MNSFNGSTVFEPQYSELILQVAWREGNVTTKLLSTLIFMPVVVRIVSNLVTAAALLRQKSLRRSRQHLLVTYVALFDLADGCWYFCMVSLDYGVQTRISCFLTLRHILWFPLGSQGATMMLTMVSLDRTIAICRPLWYRLQGGEMSHKMALTVLLWSVAYGCYLASVPLRRQNDLIPYCFTSHTFMEAFDIDGVLRMAWLGLSVLLYVFVIGAHYRYTRVIIRRNRREGSMEYTTRLVCSITNANRHRQPKLRNKEILRARTAQFRVTISLGLSCLITLLLNIIPLAAWHWLRKQHPQLQQLGYNLFTLINFSSAVNIVLFCRRHQEIKQAVLTLICPSCCRSNRTRDARTEYVTKQRDQGFGKNDQMDSNIEDTIDGLSTKQGKHKPLRLVVSMTGDCNYPPTYTTSEQSIISNERL